MHYLEQLAEQAGHPLALERLNPGDWIEASEAAHFGNYMPMALEIGRGIDVSDQAPVQEQEQDVSSPSPQASMEQDL